ncbi:hypothetical protein RhiirA4_522086 [Rhizophagus irregularis]|uniref:Uncharacterized protein n=1 Tax=Rhizophagus irregularis TaxID=588596 RepID=A0A2I1HR79_9GLOM|nr:hypothetical protein RhiirA4_522086 [Rhizophagus irregularis]
MTHYSKNKHTSKYSRGRRHSDNERRNDRNRFTYYRYKKIKYDKNRKHERSYYNRRHRSPSYDTSYDTSQSENSDSDSDDSPLHKKRLQNKREGNDNPRIIKRGKEREETMERKKRSSSIEIITTQKQEKTRKIASKYTEEGNSQSPNKSPFRLQIPDFISNERQTTPTTPIASSNPAVRIPKDNIRSPVNIQYHSNTTVNPRARTKYESSEEFSESEEESSSSELKSSYSKKEFGQKSAHRKSSKYLHREVFWIIERIPAESRLNLDNTFESQRNLVNGTIVPTVMNALDSDTFPVTEGVIYDIIHIRHKHQREEHLKKSRNEEYQDEQTRRKNLNSRRNAKRISRARTMENLQAARDPLIQKFKESELAQIKKKSVFHSPEVSETDEENSGGKRKIVVKELAWRSSTLQLFLRNYIDRLFAETSKVPKKRTRVYSSDFYEKETSAPFCAPKWTIGNYQSSLKDIVGRACKNRLSNVFPDKLVEDQEN